jgi:hypothetical protein
MLGRYQIDLVNGIDPPPVPVPSATATPATNEYVFDTHTATKNLGSFFDGAFIAPGTQIGIDGIIADDLNFNITNDLAFSFNATTLSGGITWIVDPNSAQRTVGVNVDIINSFNEVVATDTFVGLIGGQAFSQFTTSLLPGNYRLLFTGIAALGGRYHISLTTNTTPPAFTPIDDNPPQSVPEPALLVLLVTGLLGLAGMQALRRRSVSGQSLIATTGSS